MSEGERQCWVVIGADEHSGETKQMTIESGSAARAEATARKSGLLVSSVQPARELNYASGTQSEERRGTHVDSVSAGAAFKFGFFGGLGAMASWVVLWLIVGAVLSLFGFSVAALSKLLGF
jgi:hypothetical protein